MTESQAQPKQLQFGLPVNDLGQDLGGTSNKRICLASLMTERRDYDALALSQLLSTLPVTQIVARSQH
jgi:hypothetical protein